MKQSAWQLNTHSPEETMSLASHLATNCKGGEVITLTGDLGAGKTCFTQGFAQGLGVKRRVNSPTFSLIKEYQGDILALYHMDAYRVESEEEELGLEEYFFGEGVSIIEWPEQIKAQLPQERLEITILKQEDEQTRTILLHPIGEAYHQLVRKVVKT